jgi:hypothetical protein
VADVAGVADVAAWLARWKPSAKQSNPEDIRGEFLGAVPVADAAGEVAVNPRNVLSVQVHERLLICSRHSGSPKHRMTRS